ncbi:MAG TPA: universal stress protein [Segetibacter sp.]|nr:universal stress protein [Segetibacter sp.]
MKTILVPTDFSETANNAASYAIKLASDILANKIVFYNAFQPPPVITENTLPAMPIVDIETMKEISEQGMSAFLEKIKTECPPEIELKKKTGFSVLLEDIGEICKEEAADLIVMGITGTSKIEEVLIGSTALSVVKHTQVPVIVVPSNAQYHPIKNVMLASDLKNVTETTPVHLIKNLLNATKASLFVVNVYDDEKDITADKTAQQESLLKLLQDYNPRIEFENNDNFIAGINHFVETNNIDIIITIPKKHKFFEGLFTERHTKKLAFHSHVPLMFIHSEDL